MSEPENKRRLSAILAADMVGYTRLMEADEDGTLNAWRLARTKIIEPAIASHHGRIVKLTGDGFLAEFSAVTDAMHCALALQTNLAGGDLVFRMSVNLGDVVEEAGDIYGEGVNIAARLEGIADPGGICLSASVYEQVKNRLKCDFEDRGKQQLKHVAEPIGVFAICPGGGNAKVHKPNAPGTTADKPSIAALPFDNLSGDVKQEYFSDGMAEDIITALSRLRGFFVTARNSSFAYKGQSPDVRAVAKDLGVRYVLEGSVRKSGKRVRITAQLIDGESGNHIWAERYDRKLDDIFDLQDKITLTVVGAIEPELGRAERERARHTPTENLAAWESYQRGLWHLYRFGKADISEAIQLFKRAGEMDANFAAPFASLSYAHASNFIRGFSTDPAEELNNAHSTAQKALLLDPSDALAHWSVGTVCIFRRDHAAAVESLFNSIELNPSFAMAHAQLGCALCMSARYDECFEQFDQADRLGSKDPMIWLSVMGRAFAHFFSKDYETAATWAKKAASIPSAPLWTRAAYCAALCKSGRQAGAAAIRDEILGIKPDFSLAFVRRTAPFAEAQTNQFIAALKEAGLPAA